MDAAAHELSIERRIAQTNPKHRGFHYVRTCIDSFEERGPHGTHLCLVYEPMREPLWLFQRPCRGRKFPLGLLKAYVRLLLQDLKVDNIREAHPMARKVKDGRSIYLSHNDFGSLRSYNILPKITDFGLAQIQQEPGQLNRHPIQPDHYRAPEVILGAGWAYGVDIWNLGVMVCAAAHLAEMIALLGPPPKELLDRERDGRRWNFAPAIRNAAGKLCTKAYEWYGGPFFDENGNFLYEHLVPRHLLLEDTVTSLHGEEKQQFLDFASQMLQWDPDKRKSARELLDDPWLSEESIRRLGKAY
ncbi:hypothetical protein VTN96DRAFT_10427 [Rasamsonia emersonii]